MIGYLQVGRSLMWRATHWPPVPGDALRTALSIEELHRLVPDGELRPFNGQILRMKYLEWLFRAAGCSSFVETGTYFGATSTAAALLFDRPVFSVESSRRVVVAHALRLLTRARAVHLERGDSRVVLRRWLRSSAPGPRPFLYLDAHWGEDHPLATELELVLERGSSIVAIDDFAIPSDPAFGFDLLPSGQPLGMDLVRSLLAPGRTRTLVPAHPAMAETGHRRGTLVVLVDVELPEPKTAGDQFARQLLREVQ